MATEASGGHARGRAGKRAGSDCHTACGPFGPTSAVACAWSGPHPQGCGAPRRGASRRQSVVRSVSGPCERMSDASQRPAPFMVTW